ncbi:MAG: oligoribonuclease, partial [Candidatus Nanopelagicales bacterium]
MAAPDRLVWIDCEMTGLDLGKDQLVEIAVVVTDADLTELDEGINIIIRPEDLSVLEGMDPVVVDMHTSSGLLDLIPSGVPLADAEEQVLAYVRQHVPEARKAPLAGSSVYVDRGFLARDMPELDAHLHYR